MIMMPSNEKTAITAVKEHLMKKVGQTVVSKLVAKETGESMGAVTGALHTFEREGRVKVEKAVGHTNIYRVLPSISKPRRGDNAPRKSNGKEKFKFDCRGETGVSRFNVESGIKPPPALLKGGRRNKYPFDEMKVGDSFKFEKSLYKSVKASALRWIAAKKARDVTFVFATVSKKSMRCWMAAGSKAKS